MRSRSATILVLLTIAVPLAISALAGINDLFGFFSAISVKTAIVSGVLAMAVALSFPVLLRKQWPENRTPPRTSFLVMGSFLLGVLILGLGVGPFLVKFRIASADKTSAADLVDLHRFGPAQIRLKRAAQYFEDIGLHSQANDAKLELIQAYVGIGDFTGADELIEQMEKSGTLDEHQGGKLHAIRGNIAYQRGEFERADREYQLARQSVEHGTQAYASLLQNQAVLWSGKGRAFRERVLANYEEARGIYQELNDISGLANISINEGSLHETDPETARSHYQQALDFAEKVQNPYLLGTANLNIGFTFRQQGDLGRAEEHYRIARMWFQEAADLPGQANVEMNLAVVEQVRGHMELARQHLNSSEAYLRNVDRESTRIPPRDEARMLTFQADIYDEAFGDLEKAEILYLQALNIYANHPDPLQEASTLVNYATTLVQLNRGQEARKLLERAREIAEGYAQEGPHQLLGVLYLNLGKVYQDIGENDNALLYYQQSRDVFKALGDELAYAQAVENIGVLHGFLGDEEQVRANIEEAISIYRKFGNRDREVQALFNLYSSYSIASDPRVSEILANMFRLLQEYNINHEVESAILFGVLVQDIGEADDLIVYRERLNQLRRFYEGQDNLADLGRAEQKLANVEQILGNFDEMVAHAREAEKYVDEIQLPLRISVHSDLGFFLVLTSPEDGLSHFLKAFDLAGNYDVTQQQSLALVINLYTIINAQHIDCAKHLSKARNVVKSTTDSEIRSQFQGIVDALSPMCG